MRIFCAWCRKREWIDGLWVERREEGSGHSHGLCLSCAQRLGFRLDELSSRLQTTELAQRSLRPRDR